MNYVIFLTFENGFFFTTVREKNHYVKQVGFGRGSEFGKIIRDPDLTSQNDPDSTASGMLLRTFA
jgi:hypothetical protein